MNRNSMLDFKDEDYNHNAVIKPAIDDTFINNDMKYTRMIVDSKDRDVTLFPEPNRYDIVFDDDINDVLSAQLLNIYINLDSSYVINRYFNTLKFTISSTSYQSTLVTGDYSETTLASEMQTRMNASTAPSTFKVIHIPSLDKYVFLCTSPFSMDFTFQNNLSYLLGFSTTTYTSVVDASYDAGYPNAILAPYRRNFNFNNYCVMYIDQFDLNKNASKTLNKSFAIIGSNYDGLNISDDPKIIKYFNPPINKLNKLRITFYDRFGNLCDFQNMDHRFEILFKSFKQRRKYTQIFKDLIK